MAPLAPAPTRETPTTHDEAVPAGHAALRVAASLIGATAVVSLFPHLMGTHWADIGAAALSAGAPALTGLVALWFAGLAVHTVALTAAMPGLTHLRALLLSLTGSAVANVVPVGGAAGIALNHRMARRWGFSNAAFVGYTVVTNVWDLLAKAYVPVLLIPVALLGGGTAHHAGSVLVVTALVLASLGTLVVWGLFRPTVLPWLHRQVEGRRGRPAQRLASAIAASEQARADSARVARRHWRRLSLGVSLYTGLLLMLLIACLGVSGAAVPLGLVVVAFCSERLLTLVGLTPGGLGLVELGLAGVLMLAPSADGAGVASGILLYRLLTFGLEIPVGGALLAAWSWRTSAADEAVR